MNKELTSNISECLNAYIQSNCTHEIKKCMALSIMITAVTKWVCSICEAASRAADCTGYSAATIREWAFSFILSASLVPHDDITEEYIMEELASQCGHRKTRKGACTLLHNESFQ